MEGKQGPDVRWREEEEKGIVFPANIAFGQVLGVCVGSWDDGDGMDGERGEREREERREMTDEITKKCTIGTALRSISVSSIYYVPAAALSASTPCRGRVPGSPLTGPGSPCPGSTGTG